MKYTLILIFFFYSNLVKAQTTASEHMEKLNMETNPIKKVTWDYIKQASRGRNVNRLEKKRKDLILTLKSAQSRITTTPSFNGDYSLKKAFANYLNISYLVIKEDYQKIVDMELIAEETYDAMEAYLLTKEQVNAKIDSAENALSLSYASFAAKYNINLIEGEKDRLTKKLQSASLINHYYNKIYLIFFKSSFYESEMVKALSTGIIGDIEQFRQTLSTVSTEGLEDIKKIPAFRNDPSLKYACISMLNFYQTEADQQIPNQIKFFSIQDKMNTLTKNMDSKKQKDLTQKDVDEYNLAVQNFNSSINDYNKTNEFLNKKRSTKVDLFNDSVRKFYDKHL